MNKDYTVWLTRAKSSLALSKVKANGDIVYEDLCFQSQQAAEKSLKALLLFYNVNPEKTHNLVNLIKELSKRIDISDEIKEVVALNNYAVQTRYPGDYTPVTETEYKKAVKIAQKCVKWVRKQIKTSTAEVQKSKKQPFFDILDINHKSNKNNFRNS